MSQPNSPFISADMRGTSRRLALWPYGAPTAGALKDLHDTAKRAATAISYYDRQRFDIDYDARLSDTAKHQDTQKAAIERLAGLKSAHAYLRTQADSIDERRNALLEVKPYASGDYATVAIDLALAQHLRSVSTADALKAMQADPRVADVIARLPSTLTGVPETVKARMLNEAADKRNPGEAKELAELTEALGHASEGLANAARLIAQDAKLDATQFAPFAHIGSNGDAPPAPADADNEETAE